MNFSQVIAQIKDRVDLVDYAQQYISGFKRHGNKGKGLCPFHNEKTPSFTVGQQYYHCFGCGEHGDIFTFLQKIKQKAFVDIVRELADEFRIDIGSGQLNNEYKQLQMVLQDFISKAHKNVHLAQSYLDSRGITQSSIKRFQLGFVNQELLNYCQNIDADIRQKLGINHMLKDRVLFPIKSAGSIVGMGARSLGDQMPKYINSPDSILFQKRRLLYGDGFFGENNKQTLVCEGYTDVILAHQLGYKAVAPLGTSFTQDQLPRLWQIDKCPYLCFDGDSAGRQATLKASKICIQFVSHETSVKVISMPHNLDPADVILKQGEVVFDGYVQNAQELGDYIVNEMLKEVQTADQARRVKSELRQILNSMNDRDTRDVLATFWRQKLDNYIFKMGVKTSKKIKIPTIKKGDFVCLLLGIVLVKPEILEQIYDDFSALDTKEHESIWSAIINHEPVQDKRYIQAAQGLTKGLEKVEQYVQVWNEIHSQYTLSLYKEELQRLKQTLNQEFTQEVWDRIAYLNQILLKTD